MMIRERNGFALAIVLTLLASVCVVPFTTTSMVVGFSAGNSMRARLSSDSSLFLSRTTSDASESETNIDSTVSVEEPERKVAILLCPAQFCVPDDYSGLWDTLPPHIEISEDGKADSASKSKVAINKKLSRVVPLSRLDWIKVSKQLPTQDFIDANLRVHKTLDWYFDAIEEGLSAIIDSGEDIDGICIVGHSIGGWVARAYLGGLAR